MRRGKPANGGQSWRSVQDLRDQTTPGRTQPRPGWVRPAAGLGMSMVPSVLGVKRPVE